MFGHTHTQRIQLRRKQGNSCLISSLLSVLILNSLFLFLPSCSSIDHSKNIFFIGISSINPLVFLFNQHRTEDSILCHSKKENQNSKLSPDAYEVSVAGNLIDAKLLHQIEQGEIGKEDLPESITAKALETYLRRYKTPWKDKKKRKEKKKKAESSPLYRGKFMKIVDTLEVLDIEQRTAALRQVDEKRFPNNEDEAYDKMGPVREGIKTVKVSHTWNTRSEAARKRWQDPEYKAKVLAKRRDTIEKKKKAKEEMLKSQLETNKQKEQVPNLTDVLSRLDGEIYEISDQDLLEAVQKDIRSNKKRSDAMKKRYRQNNEWMEDRLKDGEELRSRLNNDEYKKERQRKRAEVARRRYENRRKNIKNNQNQDDMESPLVADNKNDKKPQKKKGLKYVQLKRDPGDN
mmetsp:Transcript_4098/g.5368  ORF Transcript_4098/g.5368 Transcript_4098/m.5368 type:complete len:403 (-) Transcript_4098:35-1243(-)